MIALDQNVAHRQNTLDSAHTKVEDVSNRLYPAVSCSQLFSPMPVVQKAMVQAVLPENIPSC